MEGINNNNIESKKYPADFIAKVKKEFPDWNKMHEFLDTGDEMVGRYLDDSRRFSIGFKDVIKDFENGKQDEILEMAKKSKRVEDLYAEWLKWDKADNPNK